MKQLRQSLGDPAFVQNPYPFYATARTDGHLHRWSDYGMVAAFSHEAVSSLLRDKRMGREVPTEMAQPPRPELAAFDAIEAHSMLEIEPPRHTRLRGLVLRAFTSRAIAALAGDIEALCHELIDGFPAEPFDLLPTYCTEIPLRTIARLLGVPGDMCPNLLAWSHAMVAMYQAETPPGTAEAANRASAEFTAYLTDFIEHRRQTMQESPPDDLITRLIAVQQSDGDRLRMEELIATCVLLLNAGHEATVHSLGNGIKALVEHGFGVDCLTDETVAGTVEEILRYDPPLHMFQRYAYEDFEAFGHAFKRGDQVALLLGAANRDPAVWPDPDRFDPARKPLTHSAFGGGAHFCVGAPLARLEMQIALQALFRRCPDLSLAQPPIYADSYHFHGLSALMVMT
ncbi:cytochrome P450 [Sulfitobacter sp. BDSS02]|nr:cytochrome P450 [Sulfitobacter sp. BDSS02]MBR9849946.1 cytochrome P450 [Paracoccaceae bacterium]